MKPTYEQLAEQVRLLTEQRDAVVIEAAQMRQIIDSVTNLDNEPQYHEQGMGCGLEDRNITDRYDAMHYGWEEAMERVYAEVIPCAEELSFPATEAYLDEVRASAIEEFVRMADYSESVVDGEVIVTPNSVFSAGHEYARQLRESKGAQS